MRLAVVEDVVTSGGQVIISRGDLRERGAIVEHAVVVIDRARPTPQHRATDVFADTASSCRPSTR